MKAAGKVFSIVYRTLAMVVVIVTVILVVLYFFGIKPYAVKTGSMEPAIHQGSLCFINHRTPFEEVHEGQVIAFKSGEMLVTHRVVMVDSDGITTKGDANNANDSAKVTKENYIGKNEAVIPFAGRFPLFAQSSGGKALVIIVFAAFLLAGLLYDKIAAKINREENEEAAVSGGNDKQTE